MDRWYVTLFLSGNFFQRSAMTIKGGFFFFNQYFLDTVWCGSVVWDTQSQTPNPEVLLISGKWRPTTDNSFLAVPPGVSVGRRERGLVMDRFRRLAAAVTAKVKPVLTKNMLVTNTATSAVLFTSGDVIQQRIEVKMGHKNRYDYTRSGRTRSLQLNYIWVWCIDPLVSHLEDQICKLLIFYPFLTP